MEATTDRLSVSRVIAWGGADVELRRAGLRTESSTFDPEAENHTVVASRI